MNEFYNIIAYNTLGEVQEVEATDDSWIATETCLDLSMLYGYAEQINPWVSTAVSMATDPQH